MVLIKHLPAMQVIIPLFSALFAGLSMNQKIAKGIAVISTIICLILSISLAGQASMGMEYVFGGWKAPFGIEYYLDYLNQPIIIFLNFILLFFLVFNGELISDTITKYTATKSQHLFYVLILFAHTGYIGVISTNDIFNIYVFIEISSLATYVLMSKGNDPRGLVGAFDYLVLGTIGATLILISIGFLLSITGSLNMTDIAEILKQQPISRTTIIAIVFFLSGAILKIAFFPMHFWMVRAYMGVAPVMLTYMAAISGIFGTYLLMRFVHFTIDYNLVKDIMSSMLRPLAMITIMICTFIAARSRNFKEVVVFSTASQIGYILLLLSIWEARDLLFQFLILDSLNKVAIFTIVAHYQNKQSDLSFRNLKSLDNNRSFKILVFLALLFSSGLPLTAMFIVKIKILNLLVINELFIELIVVLFASFFALLYHFKLGKAVFFTPKSKGVVHISTKTSGLAFIIFVQIFALLFINEISLMADYSAFMLFN